MLRRSKMRKGPRLAFCGWQAWAERDRPTGSHRPVATFRRDDNGEPVAWEDWQRATARLHHRSRGAGRAAAPVASRPARAGARPPSPGAAWTGGAGRPLLLAMGATRRAVRQAGRAVRVAGRAGVAA